MCLELELWSQLLVQHFFGSGLWVDKEEALYFQIKELALIEVITTLVKIKWGEKNIYLPSIMFHNAIFDTA